MLGCGALHKMQNCIIEVALEIQSISTQKIFCHKEIEADKIDSIRKFRTDNQLVNFSSGCVSYSLRIAKCLQGCVYELNEGQNATCFPWKPESA